MFAFLGLSALALTWLGWVAAQKPISHLRRFGYVSLVVLLATTSLSAGKDFVQHDRHSDFATDGYDQFPLSYIYGSVVDKNLIRDARGKYATNITFQPRYASESFTQNVLFCGNLADRFNGVEGPVVVTYGRIAHKMVKAVPCFDLLNVDRVEATSSHEEPLGANLK